MNITKKELLLKFRYNWSRELATQGIEGFFGDHFIFGRHEGSQVLFLINKLMDEKGAAYWSPLKIEEMLIFLPEKRLTHIQVRLWLVRHWQAKMIVR